MASKGQANQKGRARREKPPQEAAGARAAVDRSVVERGDLFFFYRPDVDETNPSGLIDVRRFHVVLRPEGSTVLRLITIGRKTLPDSNAEGERHWGFVEGVFQSPDELRRMLAPATYETATLGERHLPEARAAGEGVYAIVRQGRNTILGYALELPERPGEVQEAFHIETKGAFVLAVKNPKAGSPKGMGLDGNRRAEFPEELLARFGDRRWTAADPPDFLNYEGAELILIGGRDAGQDLGVDLEPRSEDEVDADVFRQLHLDKADDAIRPLFEGTWE